MPNRTREMSALILAAGKGTRMKSQIPKVLHPLLGKPMVAYIAETCTKAGIKQIFLVIGHQADRVREVLGDGYRYIEQTQQLGTGHALMIAAEHLKGYSGDLMVLAGDTPFLTDRLLKRLADQHRKAAASATLMTAVLDPPPAYGRIIRDAEGNVLRIVEERDATPSEKKINEVNTSHYCFRSEDSFPLLKQITNDNDQKEYYLPDLIGLLIRKGKKVVTLSTDDPSVLIGINSRSQLSEASAMLKKKLIEKWIDSGVSFLDPATVYIEPGVKIGPDTVIGNFVTLSGRTTIGRDCTIGPNVRLTNARIGNGCAIEFSSIQNRRIEDGAAIGPFASITGESE